ncbi:hypothetical protein GCM10017581_046010 [Dactylosporangium matsuzakiense]|uniref:Uncharacterized protein n=1 Tax=Dactylosporangium matsuzakiense TaxID=53360 RepID=A0A9W6KP14_9ACTN|nr:hypothetical protein GCM10017581_046010 [Dactylosporangium matsuzakiense]
MTVCPAIPVPVGTLRDGSGFVVGAAAGGCGFDGPADGGGPGEIVRVDAGAAVPGASAAQALGAAASSATVSTVNSRRGMTMRRYRRSHGSAPGSGAAGSAEMPQTAQWHVTLFSFDTGQPLPSPCIRPGGICTL